MLNILRINSILYAVVYMDFPEGSDTLTVSIDTNAAEKGARKWNVEIKQIACDSSFLGKVRINSREGVVFFV